MSDLLLTYRKLVLPEDQNHAGTLFGGRLLQWVDEAAAVYAMCQMGTNQVVTLKMSEILFKNPALNGDILEFWTGKKKIGTTSLTIECVVMRKELGTHHENKVVYHPDPERTILSCDMVFVAVDGHRRPIPHKLSKTKED